MTQVITRYFESADQAREVKFELVRRRRFSLRIVRLFDQTDGLVEALTAAHVMPETAATYHRYLAGGGAVMMVLAGYKPLNVARTAREVMAQMGAADLGDLVEEVSVKDEPRPTFSVLQDHPYMLSRPKGPDNPNYHMADWPIPLISRRKPNSNSAFPRHARMANFPIPLTVRREPYTGSIFPRHARMANFPIPLLSNRKPYTGSIFSRHARMANFPIPLISRRKPYTGSIIARHARMANWPFPHLINGKTGTNSLMPGAPRMANFPIPLLSGRKPYTGSIVPRHGRMANFPIGLISRRKPYTGSIIPRHGRMADAILPLVIKRGGDASSQDDEGFSFSKFLGLPTLARR